VPKAKKELNPNGVSRHHTFHAPLSPPKEANRAGDQGNPMQGPWKLVDTWDIFFGGGNFAFSDFS